MRNNLVLFLVLILTVSGTAVSQSFYGTEDVTVFRDGREKEFRSKEESPLLDADFENFKGLSYFETDAAFRIKAVYRETPSEQYFLMPTTSGKSDRFIKVGELDFKIGDSTLRLNAYQSEAILNSAALRAEYGHAFFVPFRDLTNGESTYGGGRYIYMKIPESADTFVDFNLAFNPSCAYGSERYSCPIPPKANSLGVRINAGEKIFVYTKKEH